MPCQYTVWEGNLYADTERSTNSAGIMRKREKHAGRKCIRKYIWTADIMVEQAGAQGGRVGESRGGGKYRETDKGPGKSLQEIGVQEQLV